MRKRYTKRGSVGKASRKQRRERQTGRDRTVQFVLDREELVGAFRTLCLARDFVERGDGFWSGGGNLWKSSEVRQWNAV